MMTSGGGGERKAGTHTVVKQRRQQTDGKRSSSMSLPGSDEYTQDSFQLHGVRRACLFLTQGLQIRFPNPVLRSVISFTLRRRLQQIDDSNGCPQAGSNGVTVQGLRSGTYCQWLQT
ncbi:uncharacterized protein [Anabrus simplex]|uniref:uncharacterized protein n=1 Tax=Anabrus simplex TaxID=316456 RepID=UPI0035A2E381